MKALVIDDSRAMRSILRGILSSLGFDVDEAADGPEGLRLLDADPTIDLALIDWNLPEISGLDVVTTLRADPKFNAVRLLMVTTETEFARVAQALSAGADEYIMKPFDRAMLLDKLVILGMAVETTTS